jgi:hypothetical protein
LCPENKDYCDPATRRAARFQSRRNRRQLTTSQARIACGKRLFHQSERAFFGITGGTVSVAESPHQSLDSASAECREGENRRDQCLRSDLGGKTNYLKISFQNNSLRRKPDDG